MSLTFSWPLLVLILLFLLLGGLTVWCYRRTLPPVPSKSRWGFILLRFLTLFAVCFLLFGPVLRIRIEETVLPRLALLIDTSCSMEMADEGVKREDVLADILISQAVAEMDKRMEVIPFAVSDGIAPLLLFDPDSLVSDGKVTDLHSALEELTSQAYRSWDGALLLSDGAHNRGANPLRMARRLSFPVYGIVIGDDRQADDIVLTGVLHNEIVYAGSEVPVDVELRGPGFTGRRVSVRLLSDDEELDRQSLRIPEVGVNTRIRLHFKPQSPGLMRLKAEVDILEGERSQENNARAFAVRVLRSKQKVFLLAGAPSPDLAFFKRILLSDENVELTVRTQKKDGAFYEGTMLSERALRTMDVMVLLNAPTEEMPLSVWRSLAARLDDARIPFFLILGNRIDLGKLDIISEYIPITRPEKTTGTLVSAQLSPEGRYHPVLRITEDVYENERRWRQFPPVYSAWKGVRVKPGCAVLMAGIREDSVQKDESQGDPLIAVRHMEDSKSMVLNAYGLFRWDLMVKGVGSSDDGLRPFLMRCVRWLATREEHNPVRLSLNQTSFQSGDEGRFSVEVYDEMYRPLDRAVVRMRLTTPSRGSEYWLEDLGDGRYQKVLPLYEGGAYRAVVSATREGRQLGEDEEAFFVSSFNPELLDTRANPELMRRMADATGGVSGPPDSLNSVVERMKFTPHSVQKSREISLSDWPLMLFLILLLLSLEWLIRRHKGML